MSLTTLARERAKQLEDGVRPIEGPVFLQIVAWFEMPVSWSQKKRRAMCGTFKTSRPDRDNIEKTVDDALNGIAYADDAQVVMGPTPKLWGGASRLEITVRPASIDDLPNDIFDAVQEERRTYAPGLALKDIPRASDGLQVALPLGDAA